MAQFSFASNPTQPVSHPVMQYCPACGGRSLQIHSPKSFLCAQCGFILYLNAGAATAALIEAEGELLLTVRRSDPKAGLLDLPGGFVDHHETIEAALVRELREELALDLTEAIASGLSLTACYVGSVPNTYPYGGITYETVDAFYRIVLERKPELTPDDDVAAVVWVPTTAIPMDDIAFESAREIICQCYQT